MPLETTDRARLSPTHNMYRLMLLFTGNSYQITPTDFAAVFHLQMPPLYLLLPPDNTRTVLHPGSLSLYPQL